MKISIGSVQKTKKGNGSARKGAQMAGSGVSPSADIDGTVLWLRSLH
jgi:hypothetical protein